MAEKTSRGGVTMTRDLALVAVIAFMTAGPAAQGLAEVARRGAGRAPAAPGRTYTNADVEPARSVEPAAPPAALSASAPTAETEPAGTADKPPAAPVTGTPDGVGRGPLSDAEMNAAQEQRMAYERKLAEELAARVRQRQDRVRALKKELEDLQRAHAAGNPAATVAARNALQQSLSEAERELGSAQRAVARADARGRDASAATVPAPQP